MPEPLTLAFVSSAFNEAENLEELHRRCRAVHAELQHEFASRVELRFCFVVADNGSEDDSLAVLEELSQRDPSVISLANRKNYGPDASVINALDQVRGSDLFVSLCSDLQDPPELATRMVRTLLHHPELDAVMAVKKHSAGSPILRLARRVYYRILSLSSRLQKVPSGFHGFACYRREVLDEALRYWNQTDLNFRQCLANASQAPVLMDYSQARRQRGASSYGSWGYWPEALRNVVDGDASASRIALLIGSGSLLLAAVVGVLLLANFLRGSSGYSGGIPTVMGLVLLSFAIQMLMFAVLSRQIETLRMGGVRPKVRFQKLRRGLPEG